MNAVMYSMKLDRFSDSRWCTLGRSCRQLVLGQLLGVDGLVHAVLADSQASDYYLGGYRRKTDQMIHFACLAAFASVPCDRLLADLMKDDRIVLHRLEYQERMRGEMEWLQDLHPLVWDMAAGLCEELSGGELRSQALSSAHTSVGFVHQRIWTAVDDYPWKLAVGDVGKHLADLAALDKPPADESVTRKIWALASSGDYPLEDLAEAVGLLSHISWSSATVEQQHASAAQIKSRHGQYGANTLCTRALIHTARLFYAVRPVDREIDRLQEKVRMHMEKKPCRVRPNGIFFREAMEVVRHKQPAGGPRRSATLQETQARMTTAQRRYKTLPASMVNRLREAALLDSVKKDQERLAAMMQAAQAVEEAQYKKMVAMRSGLPPRMIFGEAVFTREQNDRLNEVYHNDSLLGRTKVPPLRKAAMVPQLLSAVTFAQMDALPLVAPQEPVKPWWLAVVCTCRSAFSDAVLVVVDGEDERSYYRFLYAKQQPQLAMFSPLQLEDRYVQLLPDVSGEDIVSPLVDWLFSFTCDRMVVRSASEIDKSQESSIYVLRGLVDLGDRVVTDGPEVDLASFVRGMWELEKMGRSRAASAKQIQTEEQRAAWAAVVAECPWMAMPLPTRSTKKQKTSSGAAASSHEVVAADDSSDGAEDDGDAVLLAKGLDLEDVDIDGIFAKLDDMREAWQLKYSDKMMADFGGTVLGGPSTYQAARVVADYVCVESTTADAKAFTKKYKLSNSKRASISLYDGVHNATVLVTAWAHRMQFFLDLYRSSGDESYTFTEADYDSYKEQAEFTTLVGTDSKYKTVATAIRSVKP